jgi:adenylylsulfate kinase-like enzyme
VVWLSGGSAARRSSLAKEAASRLGALVVDEVDLSTTLNADGPGTAEAERRIAALAHLLASQNRRVLVSAWSPSESTRAALKDLRLELVRLGSSNDGEDVIPESFDDAWIVEAIEKRFIGE